MLFKLTFKTIISNFRAMHIPARILRAEACDLDPSLRDLTGAQSQQRDRILAIAQALMVRHGPHAISFSAFARALKLAPATLTRYFCDLDEVLSAILTNHLMAISRALGEVPKDAPNPQAARRAAYLRVTRTGYGGLTEAHYLFTAFHRLLPPDVREPLHDIQCGLAWMLCPERPHEALALLDAPAFQPADLEAALAALTAAPPQAAAALPPPPPEPADAGAPMVMRSRHENSLLPKHPDDVYILRPGGHAPEARLHAPPRE
jgi:AcrR family transcriptional regulator